MGDNKVGANLRDGGLLRGPFGEGYERQVLVREPQLKAKNLGKVDGVYGDPAKATAELGRPGLDRIVERTVEAIRKATARR